MDYLENYNLEFLKNSTEDYLTAFGVFTGVYVALYVIKRVIIQRVKEHLSKTSYTWDDSIILAVDTFFAVPLFLVVSLYFSSNFLILDPFISNLIDAATFVIVTFYCILAFQIVLKTAVTFSLGKMGRDKKEDKTIHSIFYNTARTLLWVGAVLIILQNLGYNVSAILGGFGIAGIAIAFSLQNILEDIFAFFTIYFDRPFIVGDYIVIGADSGTVEYIGLKSTRIKTLQGEQLIISNRELTSIRVKNFKKMEMRRVSFTIGVLYETPTSKLKKIPKIIKDIIKMEENAKVVRVTFSEFADSSLNFEIIYKMTTKDISVYKNTHQRIGLNIKEAFEKHGIEFAYPTRTVHLSK